MNGNDTVVAITYPQLVKVNRCINEWRHTKELLSTFEGELLLRDSTISTLRLLSDKKDSLSLMYKKEVDLSNIRYKNVVDDYRLKTRKSFIYVVLSGIFGFVLGFTLN